MHRQPRSRGGAFVGIALALLVGVWSGGPAHAQPDFTNVTDILYGRRHLLRTDDLVVAYTYTPVLNGRKFGAFVSGNLLLTSTSQITANTSGGAGGLGPATPTVTAARPFDTPYDVAVGAVFNNNNVLCNEEIPAPVQLCVVLSARPNGGSPVDVFQVIDLAVPVTGSPDNAPPLYAAAADFTGDGLDEILFVAQYPSDNSSALGFVATAADPSRKDPRQGLIVGPVFDLPMNVFAPHPIAIDTSTGTPRIFVASATGTSTPCPGGTGLAIRPFTVDPQSLALIPQEAFPVNLPEGGDACVQTVSIDVGRFGSPTGGQLAVAYAVPGGTVGVIPIDVEA